MTYAHDRQAPTGVIEARDLEPGDVIFIRDEGKTARTAHTIASVQREGSDVVITFTTGSTHITSPRMTLELDTL